MLQKVLFVGVGGSGGKTLRYTWRALDRRLDELGWRHGMPIGWRFLHIDVPELPDVVEADIPAEVGDSAYLGLAQAPVSFREYERALTQNTSALTGLGGWLPDPRKDIPPPWIGAGQRRSIGRAVSLAKLPEIGRAIDAETSILATSAATEGLAQLNAHLGLPGNVPDGATPIVVSSMGGGSGSGVALDVIEQMRMRAKPGTEWLDEGLITVLFSPDVFSALPPAARPGVEANSLGMLSEFLSAFEHEGPTPAREAALAQSGGGANHSIDGRRVGKYNFIVGSRNASVNYPVQNDVYRATGKVLCSLISDDVVRSQFQVYIGATWTGKPMQTAFRLGATSGSALPASSLGYANVSLSRNLFASYAAERLARKAVRRLLEGPTATDKRQPEAVIRDVADNREDGFFTACGLHEATREHNDVLEALCEVSVLRARIASTTQGVLARLQQDGSAKRPGEIVAKSLANMFDEVEPQFASWAGEQRIKRLEDWVRPMQVQLRNATAEYLGREGFGVTIELLGRLQTQLDSAADELARESEAFAKSGGGLRASAMGIVERIKDKITVGHPSIASAGSSREEALKASANADLFQFAADVMRQIADDCIPPLRTAVAAAQAGLGQAISGHDRAEYERWSEDTVGRHLQPAPNELLLEKSDTFPATFAEKITSVTDMPEVDEAEVAAIAEVVSGAWLRVSDEEGTMPEQKVIVLGKRWLPKLFGGQRAEFSLQLTATGIRDAAHDWVLHRQGAFADHVAESLSAWLTVSDQALAASRATAFSNLFAQAVDNSAPLVSINASTYGLVHGGASVPDPVYVISPIPIAPTHASAQDIITKLTRSGLNAATIEGLFDDSSTRGDIEITALYPAPVHPIVFGSLTSSIQADWNARPDDDSRARFWEFRRARPLPSFVPVSPSKQRAIARGWLTATLLGHVPQLTDRWSLAPLDVWTPSGRRAFPKHLLGADVASHGDVLPALMETLPMAMMAFGGGDTVAIDAYQRLLDLGLSDSLAGPGYAKPNDELGAWIAAGTLTQPVQGFPPAPTPDAEWAGRADETPEARVERLTASLTAFRDAVATGAAAQQVTRETVLGLGRGWEYADVLTGAASDLLETIVLAEKPKRPGAGGLMGGPSS